MRRAACAAHPLGFSSGTTLSSAEPRTTVESFTVGSAADNGAGRLGRQTDTSSMWDTRRSALKEVTSCMYRGCLHQTAQSPTRQLTFPAVDASPPPVVIGITETRQCGRHLPRVTPLARRRSLTRLAVAPHNIELVWRTARLSLPS